MVSKMKMLWGLTRGDRKWYGVAVAALTAGVLIAFGVKVEYLSHPSGVGMLPLGGWTIPVTLLWVVSITNAVNLIDGLDGLAAGICAIAGVTMALMSGTGPLLGVAILACALSGASVGFLRFNFNPAKVFMGDSGAYLLGFSLASIAVIGAMKTPVAIGVVVPVLLFGIPILDTVFAVLRRAVTRRPVVSRPDMGHIHHRLLRLGMSQRQVVLSLYAVSGVLCAVAYILYVRAR